MLLQLRDTVISVPVELGLLFFVFDVDNTIANYETVEKYRMKTNSLVRRNTYLNFCEFNLAKDNRSLPPCTHHATYFPTTEPDLQ